MRLWRCGIDAVGRIVCKRVSRTSGTLPPTEGRTSRDFRGELGGRRRSDVEDLFRVVPMNLRTSEGVLVEYK